MSPSVPEAVRPSVLTVEAVRSVYGQHASGIALIAGIEGSETVGLVASSFTTVSWEPPLVSFCIQNTSRTWGRLKQLSVWASRCSRTSTSPSRTSSPRASAIVSQVSR